MSLAILARKRLGARPMEQLQMRDGAGKLRGKQADQAVGLLHVAGDLGQKAVGRKADGAAQRLAHVVLDRLLDGEGDLASARRFLLAAHQLADHLVDARRVGHRAASLDCLRDAARVVRVDAVFSHDKDDLRADAFGLADLRACLDAERLGLVAGRDAAGGIGQGGDDGERPPAILRVQLLLDRGEEAVEIDMQEREAVGLGGIGHAASVAIYYIRFLFACCRTRSTLRTGVCGIVFRLFCRRFGKAFK
jgi:hypothetical protein